MANGDNVNEFENNDANEAAEAEAGEKLSKYQQKKRYKVNHAKLKKQKMLKCSKNYEHLRPSLKVNSLFL